MPPDLAAAANLLEPGLWALIRRDYQAIEHERISLYLDVSSDSIWLKRIAGDDGGRDMRVKLFTRADIDDGSYKAKFAPRATLALKALIGAVS